MYSYTIRPIESSDFEQWKLLWNYETNSYLEFYKALHKVSEDDSNLLFKRLLDSSVPIHGLVAVNDEGQLIGFAHYLTHYNTWNAKPSLYLQDLYVLNTCRLGGVGRALITAVYRAADEIGVSKVYWQTLVDNHRAQLLYVKMANEVGKNVYVRPADGQLPDVN